MRQLILLVAAAIALSGCGTDQASPAAGTPTTTTLPPVDGSFWSMVPQTDEQRAEVSARARLIDVCALVPRSELAALGEVKTVDNDQTDSCRVELTSPGATEDKVSWSSLVVFGDIPQPGATVKQLGEVTLSVLPSDLDLSNGKTCNATAKFRSGAAIYFQTTTPTTTDGCARLESLVDGAVRRWLTSPPQGTSPDTKRTALHGADPCAVRAHLDGTGPFGVPTLNSCGFTYRGEDVVVSYEIRGRGVLSRNEQTVDGRVVHILDASATVVVGPELGPATSSLLGSPVPVVNVAAESEDVAKDVLRQIFTMFPAS
ncbi:peptidase [Nocardia sp. NPDC055029]